MLIISMLGWWYGPGWAKTFAKLGQRTKDTLEVFSVGILLKTLFSPWKQIVSYTPPNAGLGDKFRLLIDNLVSRLVGFMVRVMVIIAACLAILASWVYSILMIAAWPIVPLLPIILIAVGAL